MATGVYDRGTGAPECHPDQEYYARGLCKPCYDAAYRQDHSEEISAAQAVRYAKTKAQLHRYYESVVVARRAEEKLQALALYGPNGEIKCAWPDCSVIDPDMLTLDHVEDDGRHRRSVGEGRGNSLYAKAVKHFIPGLQTLCANHNLKKELMRRRTHKG